MLYLLYLRNGFIKKVPLSKKHITLGRSNSNDLQLDEVFVSKNHAARHGSNCFVYNGLNWDNYPKPELNSLRSRFHFLGNASKRVKNVAGAIDIAKRANEEIDIIDCFLDQFKRGVCLQPHD